MASCASSNPVLPYIELVKAKVADAYASTADRVMITKVTVTNTMNQVQIRVFGYIPLADPKIQVTMASGAGGAVVCGTGGAATGVAVGGVAGAAIGVVPALFTFGLSIPVGTAIGSAAGLCIGTPIGGSVGFVGGSAAGYGGYTYRAQIFDGLNVVKSKSLSTRDSAKTVVLSYVTLIEESANSAAGKAKAKASDMGSNVRVVLADPKVRFTAAGAASGAVASGVGGGAAGLAAGGMAGAAIGLVPAIFTFGLSIPVGAAIGGGAGLCIGAGVGGTAGLVGGGATGYGVYSHRDQIRDSTVYGKLNGAAEYVKTRLRSGTGGTLSASSSANTVTLEETPVM